MTLAVIQMGWMNSVGKCTKNEITPTGLLFWVVLFPCNNENIGDKDQCIRA